MSEKNPDRQYQRKNASDAMVGLIGFCAAKLWILLPVVVSLLLMWVFGEGNYVAPVLCILWVGCVFLGLRFYRSSTAGTVRQSMGIHTIVWSLILAVMTFAWTIALVVGGVWR